MARVGLVHWNAEEGRSRAAKLASLGHTVTRMAPGPTGYRALLRSTPDAFVIDLSRLPMQGRDVGMALRKGKRTRSVPLLFVGGDQGKVATIKAQLPGAVCTTWSRIEADLSRAIARPPAVTSAPESTLAGYSGTPLPKKLGIKDGAIVALVGAPRDFSRTLGRLPPGAVLKRNPRGARDLTLWFVTKARTLEMRIEAMEAVGGKALWICWPKKASGVKTDVTEALVRNTGLAAGLVDYKICAVDATWSGLKFTRRKSGKGTA